MDMFILDVFYNLFFTEQSFLNNFDFLLSILPTTTQANKRYITSNSITNVHIFH